MMASSSFRLVFFGSLQAVQNQLFPAGPLMAEIMYSRVYAKKLPPRETPGGVFRRDAPRSSRGSRGAKKLD